MGGDAIGQFSTGDHNVFVSANASLVHVHQAGPRVKPKRRARIERLPSRTASPLGRDPEVAVLLRAIADHEPVQVYGPDGIGKSTLIRHATRELDGHDGVIFLDGYGKEPDDLLQSVFEACYDSPGHRPSDGELHALLADLRLCLIVDDFDEPSRQLVRLQDAIPAGIILVGSGERTLWGRGRAVELPGLPQAAAQQLFAKELRREMRAADTAAADLLWEACQGHPFTLLRAAALARHDTDTGLARLPAPAEIPELLHDLVAATTGVEREILALLSLAPAAEVSIDLLSVLLAPSATAQAVRTSVGRLATFGLLTGTDERVRLFPGAVAALPDDLAQDSSRITEITGRMAAWAAARDTSPVAVAEHGPFLAAWIEAVGRSGRPDLGVELARAAAPVTACSLRWGAWGRILTRGLTAAEQAGDERARAYFTHENGVRSLLTGKRVAAAAAFAVAAAAWRSLGDDSGAEIAEHGQTLADPHGGTTGPQEQPDAGAEATQDGTSAADGGEVSDQSKPRDTHQDGPTSDSSNSQSGSADKNSGDVGVDRAEPTEHDLPDLPHHTLDGHPPPSGEQGAGDGGLGVGSAKGGLTLTAKLLIGGALLAIGGGGVWVLGQGGASETEPTVPLRVQVATNVFEVGDMPGTTQGSCRVETGRTDCTKVVQVAKGEEGPITVVPDGPLPAGVRIVYWGCDQGAQSATCTVKADAERSICVTTTSPLDNDARAGCAASGTGPTSTTGPASAPPWARIAGVWNRQDGAQFSFDGHDARWTPGNTQDLTVCRSTVANLSDSTTIEMICQNPDTSRQAKIRLSTTGDIGTNDRTLTITGDTVLSGVYGSALRYADASPFPSSTEPASVTPRPVLDPCELLKPDELARTAPYLDHEILRQRSLTSQKDGPQFGTCSYSSEVAYNHPDVGAGVIVTYSPTSDAGAKQGCQRLDISDRSWLCPDAITGKDADVFVELDDGTELRLSVSKGMLEDTTSDYDPVAAQALMKIIVARI